ncbi:ankyrin repeats (3 copies) domain-containing protein [Purpureocillium lavendulum]|uniref:Ankyrin repeats (3 copies) domain-containing protein n=1 Tax=Purpureocillium lavendulum TaxID=1247861 RepID=A0AB34G3Y2_9HYPO|nr:ankyrin repeats (3 copies) domain-containing protein [Purpureocillium lavendulum]
MAVQILSDLHLETPKAYDIFDVVPKAPVLALLGDIGNIVLHKEDCLDFFSRQLAQFRAVLFVPGNHEAYHSDWPKTLDALRAFEHQVRSDDSIGEFVLLDRASYRLPETDVVILGCSLFSFVPRQSEMNVSLGINDFFQTNDWDVSAHNKAHARDLAWLNDQVMELEQSDRKIIIFTHWSPTTHASAIDPRHAQSPITSGFSTDLSGERCFASDSVKLWAFGHTHYNCDFSMERGQGVGPLRIVANQRGYYFSQSEGFDGEKVVTI